MSWVSHCAPLELETDAGEKIRVVQLLRTPEAIAAQQRVRDRRGYLLSGFFLCPHCRKRTERIDQDTRCCFCGESVRDENWVKGAEECIQEIARV